MRMSGWSSDVCSSDLDQAFDYLFVDEAGQVGLANVVAMGVAARNIVLVGDQMQLAQPIQGTHPRESGVSGLQHLLQNHATVPPERGVFLSETRRSEERREGKSVSVRVDLGGRRIIKKKRKRLHNKNQ